MSAARTIRLHGGHALRHATQGDGRVSHYATPVHPARNGVELSDGALALLIRTDVSRVYVDAPAEGLLPLACGLASGVNVVLDGDATGPVFATARCAEKLRPTPAEMLRAVEAATGTVAMGELSHDGQRVNVHLTSSPTERHFWTIGTTGVVFAERSAAERVLAAVSHGHGAGRAVLGTVPERALRPEQRYSLTVAGVGSLYPGLERGDVRLARVPGLATHLIVRRRDDGGVDVLAPYTSEALALAAILPYKVAADLWCSEHVVRVWDDH